MNKCAFNQEFEMMIDEIHESLGYFSLVAL